MLPEKSIRLNKFISESGFCSRRQADQYIEQGLVFLNGKRAGIGAQVFSGNKVMINGQELPNKASKDIVIIALNKPIGVTSTTEKDVNNNVIEFVNYTERIFPIGRLDKDSQGLILLTNDGDIVNKILRAGNKHEKEYLVTVNKPITDQFIQGMQHGVPIMGVNTKKCFAKQESPFVFRIILIQGLNRQIRRMCEHFGYEVTKLERTRIMNISLKGIPTGDWRALNAEEMVYIYSKMENSVAEPKPKKTKPENPDKKESTKPLVLKSNANPDKRNKKKFQSAKTKTKSQNPVQTTVKKGIKKRR